MSTDIRLGTTVASYRIVSRLGRGGMSVVYLAEDARLGRQVALKLMAEDFGEDPTFRERFIRESRVAASLEHPNIVPIYEAGEDDGLLYLAMRHIPGGDLGVLMKKEGALTPDRVLPILAQVSRALDAAHDKGLVHRDVKPGNVLLDVSSEPIHAYLSDFGITKKLGTGSLTRTGAFVGTVDYTAPEQLQGQDIDARTDVYSLGCLLYQCFTGHLPFERDNPAAVMHAHLYEEPPKPSEANQGLPPMLDQVVARAMAKKREGRYETCGSLILASREAAIRATTVASVQTHTVITETKPEPLTAETISFRSPERSPVKASQEAATVGSSRRRLTRLLLYIGTAALCVAFASLALRLWTDSRWFVGQWRGHVTIFQGIQAKVLWFKLNHPARETTIPAFEARRLKPYRGLAKGITVANEGEANLVVQGIRADLASERTRVEEHVARGPIRTTLQTVAKAKAIRLSWAPVHGATGYEVLRLHYASRGVSRKTHYDWQGLTPEVEYCFMVRPTGVKPTAYSNMSCSTPRA
jgi:serine/threonine protein kinase